jgi:phosphohistidine swiveling domain-containing protein
MVVPIETAAEAKLAATRFASYRKLRSWLLLREANLPTPRGVIISEWGTKTSSDLTRWARGLGIDRLLLRSDRVAEDGAYPRGGFLVSLDDIEMESRWFLEQGRIVFLMEPYSPFDDLYSFSVRLSDTRAEVEVVGAGFDASDLKRGDESPHERLLLARSRSGLTISHRNVVSPRRYKPSWERRCRKVGRLIAGRDISLDDAAAGLSAVRRLPVTGETLLLENSDRYTPIPDRLLLPAVSLYAAAASRSRQLARAGAVVSASFVGRSATLIFWDVCWPELKYEGAPDRPLPMARNGEERTPSSGTAAGGGRYVGRACVAASSREFYRVKTGDVLVTPMTTPDIVLVLGKIGALVTEYGGRLSHAAIVAREAGIPAVVGAGDGARRIKHGALVRVDGDRGIVELVAHG